MSIRREMGDVNYFKNFNMGREIEIAGEFIYESMREMYSLKSFSEHFKINKILYNGAVGIERLQKILLCMFLINQTKDFDDLPKSLKEHKHIALHELIKKSVPDYKLKSNKIKLLEVFQDYYNKHRYGEFSPDYNSNELINLFTNYFSNILQVEFTSDCFSNPCDLSNAKKLYINYLRETSYDYYKIIDNKATELGIYTTELSYTSNATKLFYSQDFGKMYESIKLESIAVKELIVFLSKTKSRSNVKKIIASVKPLDLDIAMVNDYLDDITCFRASEQLTDMVYELYNNIESEKEKKERKELVDLIGNPYIILD